MLEYLDHQYIAPLSEKPPIYYSPELLVFDCTMFLFESGLFFVMSRSLSASRWHQFYLAIILLLTIDLFWVAVEVYNRAALPTEFALFDFTFIGLIGLFLARDRKLFSDLKNEISPVYGSLTFTAIFGLVFGYFVQFSYLNT